MGVATRAVDELLVYQLCTAAVADAGGKDGEAADQPATDRIR